jgi:hypothetical protein
MQDGLIYYLSIISIHSMVLFTGLFAKFTLALAVFGSLPAIAVAGVAFNRMLLRLQSVLLFNDTYASGIGMTAVDVSARIAVEATSTMDVEEWDSTLG